MRTKTILCRCWHPRYPLHQSKRLKLIQQLQIAINTYLNNPPPANNTTLQTSLINLYNFLLNTFSPPTEEFQIVMMLQSLYTTLSILLSEFIRANVVWNQISTILSALVTQTSSVSAGTSGPTGAQGPQGP